MKKYTRLPPPHPQKKKRDLVEADPCIPNLFTILMKSLLKCLAFCSNKNRMQELQEDRIMIAGSSKCDPIIKTLVWSTN